MSKTAVVKPRAFAPRFRATVSAFRNTSGMITALPIFRTTPPPVSLPHTAASVAKSRQRHLAGRRAVHGRLLVDDVRADRRMHGDGHASRDADARMLKRAFFALS